MSKAVSEGKASVDFRYRYEFVEQDGFDEDANASLLRSRLTLESGRVGGFAALIEVDNVTSIIDNDYNSTENGKTEFPVVADPEGTDLNQAWIAYFGEAADGHLGRQRINHGSQRFIGGVAWRQNEQTYDGLRVQWRAVEGLMVDASYVYGINRIFGPDDGGNPARLKGDNGFARLDYKINDNHKIAGFGYLIDIDEKSDYPSGKTANLSNDTLGLEYKGQFGWFGAFLSYATQQDRGSSQLSYEADYYNVELSAKFKPVTLTVGYEVLEGDNGVGFQTPLATLHKFQGWADKFLTTPGDGIEDTWGKIGGELGPVKLAAVYHDFQAQDSSADFGNEIDLVATWPVNKQFSVQAKYAYFQTDNKARYPDTTKAWLTLQLKLGTK